MKAFGVCVCFPVLVTTFPEWLSGTEPLPHTPEAVSLWENGKETYTIELGRMTKISTMSLYYGKKIVFFDKTNWAMTLKFSIQF